jgi:hypothetical protein
MASEKERNLVLVPVPSFLDPDWPLTKKGAAALAEPADDDEQREADKQKHPSSHRPSNPIDAIPRHVADGARQLAKRRHAAQLAGNVVPLFGDQGAG